ncbi:MAG: TlpA disulfide reductase family protein [Ferruginibacter sp.]
MVYLSGTIKQYHNEMPVEDMSELKDLMLPDGARTFLPDSNGKFALQFKLAAPNYFRIGRNILYLSPGDKLTVTLNYNRADSASFTGTHSAENKYLRNTPFPKGGSFLEGGSNIKTSVTETINAIMNASASRSSQLAGITKAVPREFRLMETARINADIINSLQMIASYYPYIHHLKGDSLSRFKNEKDSLVAPLIARYATNFVDPGFLKLVVYRDILDIVVAHNATGNINIKKIQDFMGAEAIVSAVKYMNQKNEIKAYTDSVAIITNPLYKKAVTRVLDQLLIFGNGDMAKDFAYTNTTNETIHLNAYKSKVIYIDLWATWCGPCIEEMPAMEKLKAKYSSNADIVFLTLSIDEDVALWKRYISNKSMSGKLGIIDRNKLNDYKITGVPRIIVIDKNFTIAAMNGSLPSAKSTTVLLDKLLK